MNRSKKEYLKRESLHLTTILAIIIDEYGVEALNWDPETIKMELEDDADVSLSESMIAKIGCALQVMTSDSFYTSLPDFITICNVASGDLEDPGLWNPADPFEIVSAVSEIRILNPPENKNIFSTDIIGYIEIQLRRMGVAIPPNCLKFIPSDNLALKDIGAVQYDPTLFAASYQMAQDASAELQECEDNTLVMLLDELKGLQLEHGATDNIFKGVRDGADNRITGIFKHRS